MDSTLIAGILGAIATISSGLCSATCGATATILAAVISKFYVGRRIKVIKDVTQQDSLTSLLLRVFNFFRVAEAVTFDVIENKTFIDPETGITISVHEVDSDSGASFTYQLPEQQKSVSVKDARFGWRKLLEYKNTMYALTLIEAPSYDSVKFDFRKVYQQVLHFNAKHKKTRNTDDEDLDL